MYILLLAFPPNGRYSLKLKVVYESCNIQYVFYVIISHRYASVGIRLVAEAKSKNVKIKCFSCCVR